MSLPVCRFCDRLKPQCECEPGLDKPTDPFAALSRPDRELLIEACNYADWWLEERCEDNKQRKEFQRLKKMLEVKP